MHQALNYPGQMITAIWPYQSMPLEMYLLTMRTNIASMQGINAKRLASLTNAEPLD
jgi:hypothetical protein